MNWTELISINQLENIRQNSFETPCVIFKHSTRCSISAMALHRFEKAWEDTNSITPYYLDLLQHRDISNKIAEDYHVHHESPQIILIKNGECILDASHLDIEVNEVLSSVEENN